MGKEEEDERERWLKEKDKKNAERRKELEAQREQAKKRKETRKDGENTQVNVGKSFLTPAGYTPPQKLNQVFRNEIRESFPGDDNHTKRVGHQHQEKMQNGQGLKNERGGDRISEKGQAWLP